MGCLLILLIIFKTYSCDDRIDKLFEEVNEGTIKFNSVGADIAWQYSVDPNNAVLPTRAANYQSKRIIWQQKACERVESLQERGLLNTTQERQAYLLCRGPKFTYHEARVMSDLYEELQSIYSNAKVCIPTADNITDIASAEDAITQYLLALKRFMTTDSGVFPLKEVENKIRRNGFLCIKGEEEFNKLMESSKNPEVLKFVWVTWRENMRSMKAPYRKLINLQNRAALRNGYTDIGASWRDELEIKDLRAFCRHLYESIKPLYELLHGVVRFFLRQQYGDLILERGLIPAHLLGNLWSQNWESLADYILPEQIDLDERIKRLNWTADDMVKRAEDFYVSLGLPAMTPTFWSESVLTRDTDSERCHGSAADMYGDGDFRLLYCSGNSFGDFYVIHHEMGHIQYYMAYQNQPGLFRQANTALHESIGDAIMYGVRTPQHLHRLRIINDTELFNIFGDNNSNNNRDWQTSIEIENKHLYINNVKYNNIHNVNFEISDFSEATVTTDDILILKQALNKLPQIPFSLLIDEYRWRYFEGSLDESSLNKQFWEMVRDFQGISPTDERGEEYFDVGAIFHVADNTPYIRYFLSSFLQHQIFECLCRVSVMGRRLRALPAGWDLHRCDIYGSKTAGKTLKDLMSRGTSQHWREILKETIGESDISAASLKRYYRPLYKTLTRLVEKHGIPIGW